MAFPDCTRARGCGSLGAGLEALDLIDNYRTMIYPVVVGSRRKRFADGAPRQKLALVETIPCASGPVMPVHRPLQE